MSSQLGIGPWYCEQCRVQRWKVHKTLLASADDQESHESSVSVGNFIRGDANLVLQSSRSSRYSEKFRAGVVRRVLDGKQSLSQIANELEVPQADILVWVAQQFDQKQHQIEQLSRTVDQLREFAPDQVRLEMRNDGKVQEGQLRESSDSSDVIEGRVN